MKQKKYFLLVGLAAVLWVSGSALVFAGCPFGSRGEGGGMGRGEGRGCEMVLTSELNTILESQEALGLSDEKMTELQKLQAEFEKAQIKQDAEIKVFEIDLKTQLEAYPLDAASVTQLLDQKYDLKKAKAKASVEVLAQVRNALTQEQYSKLQELLKAKKAERKEKMGRHPRGQFQQGPGMQGSDVGSSGEEQ